MARVYPNGLADVNHFHAAGGLQFMIGELLDAGLLHPDTRRDVLARIAGWLAPNGRAVIGFGAGRGYEFGDFFRDAEASGLVRVHAFSTWDLQPFTADADFLVAVFARA